LSLFQITKHTFSLCISSICAVVSQYAGGKYHKLIKQAGLTQSMNRNGQRLDNAPLKKALVHRQHFKTCAQAKAAIFEYIEVFYNRQRRRSGIGYQTPQQACNYMTWKMAA
jgi:transposase InsO family protein